MLQSENPSNAEVTASLGSSCLGSGQLPWVRSAALGQQHLSFSLALQRHA